MQSEYSRNETLKQKIYRDKLNEVISGDFFKAEFKQIEPRQEEVHADIERLKKKNFNYMKERLMILDLMKNIKNQYVKTNLEQKAKILKAILSN